MTVMVEMLHKNGAKRNIILNLRHFSLILRVINGIIFYVHFFFLCDFLCVSPLRFNLEYINIREKGSTQEDGKEIGN